MRSEKFGAMRMKLLAYTRSTLGRAHRVRRGQSLVEFALVAPLFFLLVFAITDFGRLFFTRSTLQYALREAGRYAVTGQKQATFTRPESIRKVAQKYAVGLLNPSDIQICSLTNGTKICDFAGGPNQIVVVSLTTHLKLITPLIGRYFGPDGTYTFTVSTSFKNEPFDLGDTN
jgi:Flp pilus assembly protein TadG